MSFKAEVYRVLIASPSSITEEQAGRDFQAINEWNSRTFAVTEGVVLLPVKWETHATLGLVSGRSQAINDELRFSTFDILVGMFATIGTPRASRSLAPLRR